MPKTVQRSVKYLNNVVTYTLERKNVKNINLRIRRDGTVHASAHPMVSVDQVDRFVKSKIPFILNARQRYKELAARVPVPAKYENGEGIYLLGKPYVLRIKHSTENKVYTLDNELILQVKYPDRPSYMQNVYEKAMRETCKEVFLKSMKRIYPSFEEMGIKFPQLKIRSMVRCWGSCMAKKGVITLNTNLLAAPLPSIDYVVMHEFCHFIHQDHSRNFYALLEKLMPDWKERKKMLDDFSGEHI